MPLKISVNLNYWSRSLPSGKTGIKTILSIFIDTPLIPYPTLRRPIYFPGKIAAFPNIVDETKALKIPIRTSIAKQDQ